MANSRLAPLATLVVAGCNVITPPPLVMRHRTTMPPAPGTTTAMVMVGFGGELLGDDGIGVQVVGAHQLTDELEAGLGIGFAKNSTTRDPDSTAPRMEWLLAARAFLTVYPPRDSGVEWTCGTVGLGAGMGSTGLRYWTADLVAAFGVPIDDTEPHLDLSIAYSSPWTTGGTFSGKDKLPTPTWHLGASLGLAGSIDGHLASAELTGLFSYSQNDSAANILVTGAYAYGAD